MLFMKMAQAREARKDNKGFSLVELIIVIAIMVALVAMLAPQFVKYVSKSRDAVISSAAEDVLATAKSEFALTNLQFTNIQTTTAGTIKIGANNDGTLTVVLDSTNLKYCSGDGTSFVEQCGVDSSKSTQSKLVYQITITNNSGSPTFEMKSNNDDATITLGS